MDLEIKEPKFKLFQKVVVEFETSFRHQTVKVLEKVIIIGVLAVIEPVRPYNTPFSTPFIINGNNIEKTTYEVKNMKYKVCNIERYPYGIDEVYENQIVEVIEDGK